MKKSYIEIHNMVLMCHLGWSEEERSHRQKIFVSCKLYGNFEGSEKSDSLADTVDYAEVVATITEMVEKENFRLIEYLANEIRKVILDSHSQVTVVDVWVRKPNVLQTVEYVAYTSIG